MREWVEIWMLDSHWMEKIGWFASLLLPFFNIPLIIRMIKRRSSDDISLLWLFGVYLCLCAMEPAAWVSDDRMFKVFATTNLLFFSAVTGCVLYYRLRRKGGRRETQKPPPRGITL